MGGIYSEILGKYSVILGKCIGIWCEFSGILDKYFGNTGKYYGSWSKQCYFRKLDGVCPVDNRHSINLYHHFVKKKKMWHVICDMWHVTGGGRWTFSKNFSSLALTAWEGLFVEYLEEKADGLSAWINDEGVCRTAPATPGLLKQPRLHRVC